VLPYFTPEVLLFVVFASTDYMQQGALVGPLGSFDFQIYDNLNFGSFLRDLVGLHMT
jgi:hypothetical protein